MGTEFNKALSWEIDNFSERTDVMKSDTFSSGGCNWFLCIYAHDHYLSMYLKVVDTPHKLRPGWERRVSYFFVLLNQSGKELFRSPDEGKRRLFCTETPTGLHRTLHLKKLKEKGFLEENKLTIEVYIKVIKLFEVGYARKPTENDVLDYNGFHIFASQATRVGDIFRHHPDFALDVIPMNQAVRTTYMNLLLGLVETLRKSPPMSLSVTELRNAQVELTELTEAGFKLDWLNLRLEELSLERKKVLSDGPLVKQLEEQVKNVELTLADLKVELDKEKIRSIISSQPGCAVDVIRKNQGVKTMSDGSRVRQLEGRMKNVELTLSDLKDELDRERIKSAAKVSSFGLVDSFIKRFFLSCFSFSKY